MNFFKTLFIYYFSFIFDVDITEKMLYNLYRLMP